MRIKGVLLLKRNATRDYVDFAALASGLGTARAAEAFNRFDALYPQESGESSLQQMLVQLVSPQPFDLEEESLSEYKDLARRWHDRSEVEGVCAQFARAVFDHACDVSNPTLSSKFPDTPAENRPSSDLGVPSGDRPVWGHQPRGLPVVGNQNACRR